MSDAGIQHWFPYAFPFIFVGMWFSVTTILGLMSGWFSLQQQFPDDGNEEPLLKLNRQSGSMGLGVSMSGILKLHAYPSGLGVRISRLFGPFQKPLKIPWSEIEAQSSNVFLMPVAKLRLNSNSDQKLTISARSWNRLVDITKPSTAVSIQMPAAVRVSRTSTARGMFLQWLIVTSLAAAFFYFAPRFNGLEGGLPVGVAIGFPAVLFGFAQLGRFFRE